MLKKFKKRRWEREKERKKERVVHAESCRFYYSSLLLVSPSPFSAAGHVSSHPSAAAAAAAREREHEIVHILEYSGSSAYVRHG